MKALISKRAMRAAERIAAHWGDHADDPDVFARELLHAIEVLETTRSPGTPFPTAKHPALKRLLLRRSGCHLYFEIDAARQIIEILHVWDARRGRSPRL